MDSPHYVAYLLRVWRGDESSPWRALLENPHTGETLRFASLPELFRYLSETTGAPSQPDSPG